MSFPIPFGKKASVDFKFLDAAGNPAPVDGLPAVTTVMGTADITATADGFNVVVDLGGVGVTSVSGTADVDLGAGVKTLAFAIGDFEGLASPEASAVAVGTPSVI